MDKIYSTLKELDLNEKEIKIYLAALTIGQATSSILAQKACIARTTAQHVCKSLVEKRLFNATPKSNGVIFSPEPPEKLVALANRDLFYAERKVEKTHSIIRDLKNLSNPNSRLPKVKYFTGKDGIIDMFKYILNDGHTVKGFITLGKNLNKDIIKYLKNEYIENRKKLGIHAYAIINESERGNEFFIESDKYNRHMKFIPDEEYPIDTCIQIYGNKVSFISFIDNDLTGIIVENEHIAKTNLSIFTKVWNSI